MENDSFCGFVTFIALLYSAPEHDDCNSNFAAGTRIREEAEKYLGYLIVKEEYILYRIVYLILNLLESYLK